MMNTKTFAIENAVDPELEVYVDRAQDDEVLACLATSFICHIQGSRMCGKSSLLLRVQQHLTTMGVRVLYADLATVGKAEPLDLCDAVRRLLSTLARRSRLKPPACVEDSSISVPADLLAIGLAELSADAHDDRASADAPGLVVLLDELDVVAGAPWGAGFFAVLRDLALRRRRDAALAPLRIVVAGVRPFRHLVADPGAAVAPEASIWLDDFPNDSRSIAALEEGFPGDLRPHASALAWKALEFTGGYPQACTWLCRMMIAEGMPSELSDLQARVVQIADRAHLASHPPLFFSFPDDYLRSFARTETPITGVSPHDSVIEALWVYRELLDKVNVPFDSKSTAHLLLRWAGLARCDQIGDLHTRSPMLELFYTDDWARKVRRTIEMTVGRAATAPRVDAAASARGAKSRRRLPKVHVLTTGGTIGMVEDSAGKVRAPRGNELNEAYREVGRIADVEFLALLDEPRDSADIVPDDWRRIALAVAERITERDVAGVVVTHGTDTLAYTASAVAYALGKNLTKPVVFTGAQATVNVPHGDALPNLLRACKVAADAGDRLPEVVVCFGDTVLRACQAQKRNDWRFSAFESPLGSPLAIVTEEIQYNHDGIRRHDTPPPPLDVQATFDTRVLTIAQVPGLPPELLDPVLDTGAAEGGLRGIIIQSQGAGNLPTRKGYSLLSFIQRAVEKDIPVLLCSLYPVLSTNPRRYAPAEEAMRAGAVDVFNITLPAVVTKLAWILGQMPDDYQHGTPGQSLRRTWVEERIRTNYVGEILSAPAELAFEISAQR